ncbi:TetR/AcrR family transcriptional regulator [Nostoc flagelliforme FACHB-838]|uniref:TetR/AcrR family transcriptional regulator n=1 Tax=Nostoc flagelliforme FACHB-838 TaxID=2692904 RepID=A0ABR8E8B3_9NOSO|nr:TetR/AcrR family transcriptional regulator [Nostoc flagelliforme]MBD2536848.1 TetR/AcrR family transcriptional regulator [Nostoc flagelliforme FACHB-838]
MPKQTYIPCLLNLLRQYGYDGATLSKISQATGLGKASLYHHFPGGKDEMVEAVLNYLESWLDQNILQTLESPGEPLSRLRQMCDHVDEVYDGGKQPCLSAILLLGSARDVFHDKVKAIYQVWIDAIANVLIESGMNEGLALRRAEDAVTAIQGSLIVSQGLDDPSVFVRLMQHLPENLCKGTLP